MKDLEQKIIENEYRKRKLFYNVGDKKQREYLNSLRDQINLSKSPNLQRHTSLIE